MSETERLRLSVLRHNKVRYLFGSSQLESGRSYMWGDEAFARSAGRGCKSLQVLEQALRVLGSTS
jgi:hypothetical protein